MSELKLKQNVNHVKLPHVSNLHLLSLSPPTDQVIFYSDACGGQNRNQVIATCFVEAVETIPSMNIIDNKLKWSVTPCIRLWSMQRSTLLFTRNTNGT